MSSFESEKYFNAAQSSSMHQASEITDLQSEINRLNKMHIECMEKLEESRQNMEKLCDENARLNSKLKELESEKFSYYLVAIDEEVTSPEKIKELIGPERELVGQVVMLEEPIPPKSRKKGNVDSERSSSNGLGCEAHSKKIKTLSVRCKRLKKRLKSLKTNLGKGLLVEIGVQCNRVD